MLRDYPDCVGRCGLDFVGCSTHQDHPDKHHDCEQVAEVHGELFQDVRPTSTVIQAARFVDPDWRVENEADAVTDLNES